MVAIIYNDIELELIDRTRRTIKEIRRLMHNAPNLDEENRLFNKANVLQNILDYDMPDVRNINMILDIDDFMDEVNFQYVEGPGTHEGTEIFRNYLNDYIVAKNNH